MNLKKILVLMLSLLLVGTLMLTFASCDGGNEPAETTDGSGETSGDGTDAPEGKEHTLILKTDSGEAAAGVSFTLTMGASTYPLTSGADGTVKVALANGVYSVSYDHDTLPEACIPDTIQVEVTADTTEITLLLVNNTPDGSAEKPFFISENVTAVSIGAGEKLYYNYRGAAGRTIEIENENITVTYNGETYSAVNGIVSVQLKPEIGSVTQFSLENVSDSKVETSLELVSPLGSMDNPIVLTETTATATVPADGAVCYKWTAAQDGILIVSSENTKNNISMANSSTGAVSAQTGGALCEYMAVSAGDEIVIAVSSLATGEAASIEFTVAAYAGTADAPIPTLKDSLDLSMKSGMSLSFAAEAGTTVEINDENVSVVYNGTTYTPNASGVVTLTLEGDAGASVVFTVTNTSENTNGVEIQLS